MRRTRENAPRQSAPHVPHWMIERVSTREAFAPLFRARVLRTKPPPGRSLVEQLPPGALSLARWPFATVMAERGGTPDAAAAARLPPDAPAGRPRPPFAYRPKPAPWREAPTGPRRLTLAAPDGA